MTQNLQQSLNNAIALHQSGNLGKASELYGKLVKLLPKNAEILHLYGILHFQKGDYRKSERLIRKAIAINPKNDSYYTNLGNTLIGLKKTEQAIFKFKKALQINPSNLSAIGNLATALNLLGKYDEEIKYLEKGLNINPNDFGLMNELVKTKAFACDLTGLNAYKNKLIEHTKQALAQNQIPALTPYHSLTLSLGMQMQFDIAKNYEKLKFTHIKPAFQNKSQKTGKIRIGYVSGDYRDHPTAHLMQNMFGYHSDEFEVFAYSIGENDNSIYRRDIEESCDHFVDLYQLPASEAAKKINSDGIDILVDVMGYIQNATPEIFALKPAPVQISFLAYPGTMGAEFIDYLISDEVALPPEDQKYFSEQIIYMPDSYFVTNDKMQIADTPSKDSCGLPDDKFIFCCFNKTNKIDSRTMDAWAEILKQTKDSVLWLLTDNKFIQGNIKKEFTARNIDESRIIFAKRLPKEKHLARCKNADLFLDCFAVNAHTTAIDCLYAELPIITLQGSDIISRASSSIISAIDLPELITKSESEFIKLACSLAKDGNKLKSIQDNLSKNIKSSALFDTKNYVKNLEERLKKVTYAN